LDRDGEVDGHAHMKPKLVLFYFYLIFFFFFFFKICNCQMPWRSTCTSEMQMVDHFLSDYN
jgi:hypothetical protein